jgi:putative transposase
MVVDALEYGQRTLGHYTLHAYVVMANHVHVLLTPLIAPAKILLSLKGFTAREANRLIDRTGETFWQSESYDHWVQDAKEFEKIRAYIENNPVMAGVVARAEEYEWSSAAKKAGMTAGLQT